MRAIFRQYRGELAAAALVFAFIAIIMGPVALVPLSILVVLEVSFSFDNAVVNAKVLNQMSERWQRVFMTGGILVAVGGMRFVFPILVVSLTAHLGFGAVVHLAFSHPQLYATKLASAHPQIAMFGGVFLAMIFLDFVFEDKELTWISCIERPLAKVGKVDMAAPLIVLISVIAISMAAGPRHELSLLISGSTSLAAYLVVNAIANVFESEDEDETTTTGGGSAHRTGWSAFALFVYLEAQDASFSFDGVSGAFAVTDKVLLIAAGLGIGALFVRAMTVHLLRSGKLAEYRYLDHGAHWAIGVLAGCLLATIFVPISDYITGSLGVLFIGAAVWHSIRTNRRDAERQAPAVLTSATA